MRRLLATICTCAALAIMGAACSEGDGVVEIDTTGTVIGLSFVDRNGNDAYDAGIDAGAASIAVQLVPRGGGAQVATATTTALGVFLMANIPVGDYELRVNSASIADSLRLLKIDSAALRVTAGDTVGVIVTLGYPAVTVREARSMATGKRVFISGVTYNGYATFGDSTLHVADTSGTIRATRVLPASVTAGQNVRLLGTTSAVGTLRTLTDVTVFVTGSGTQAAPAQRSTSAAAGADAGTLDAALTKVTGAVIVGSQTNTTGDVILSVNDGSGILDVVIARSTGIPTTSFVPGATLTATGLLVSGATPGVWVLKPRTPADLAATFTTVTVDQARKLPTGRVVLIEGTALNTWFTFADSTVHLVDSTGSIRATRVAPVTMFAGDRIRLQGTVALRDGQTVLTQVTPTVLGTGVAPLPEVIKTLAASSADGGKYDAALVKVIGASIDSTALQQNSDLLLVVNDGSGKLDVLLDRDVGFAFAPFVKGATLDVTGLLVTKTGGAAWILKPRQPTDITVR